MGKPEDLSARVNVRVTPRMLNAIIRAAQNDKRSPSDWMRLSFESTLQGKGKR